SKREKDKLETKVLESSSSFQQTFLFQFNLPSDSHQRKLRFIPQRRETVPKTSNKTNTRKTRKNSLPNYLSIPNAIQQFQATNDHKGGVSVQASRQTHADFIAS
ncbi:19337_t:CDS:1, partial [Racocetra persica]